MEAKIEATVAERGRLQHEILPSQGEQLEEIESDIECAGKD